MSVRASGPSRSSHAVTRNGARVCPISTALHEMPSGPAPPSPPGGTQSSTPPLSTQFRKAFAVDSSGAGAAQIASALPFQSIPPARAGGITSAVRSVRVRSGAAASRRRLAIAPSPTTDRMPGRRRRIHEIGAVIRRVFVRGQLHFSPTGFNLRAARISGCAAGCCRRARCPSGSWRLPGSRKAAALPGVRPRFAVLRSG